MKKELAKYYREINQKMLNCPRKKRVSLIRSLQLDVDNYLSETPNATIHDVHKKFGTPDVIAEAFLQNGNIDETDRQFNSRKILIRVVVILLAILVIGVLIIGGLIYYDTYRFNHGYIVEHPPYEGDYIPVEGAGSLVQY